VLYYLIIFIDIATASVSVDPNATYEEFVKAVHALYPGSEEECKWSVVDMDKLVGEQSCLGIISLADLGDYFRHFYTITNRDYHQQSRAFV